MRTEIHDMQNLLESQIKKGVMVFIMTVDENLSLHYSTGIVLMKIQNHLQVWSIASQRWSLCHWYKMISWAYKTENTALEVFIL